VSGDGRVHARGRRTRTRLDVWRGDSESTPATSGATVGRIPIGRSGSLGLRRSVWHSGPAEWGCFWAVW
jgi:hypothetical protein